MKAASRWLAAGLVLLAGCRASRGPAGASNLDGASPLAAITRDLRRELAGRAPEHACGAARPFTSSRPLLVLTARECLGCRSAGFLLRQLARRTGFDVLTPDADAAVVCRFLDEERAAATVFRFPARRFGEQQLGSRFLLFRRDSRGGILAAVLDGDAGRLLAQWDSLHQRTSP